MQNSSSTRKPLASCEKECSNVITVVSLVQNAMQKNMANEESD